MTATTRKSVYSITLTEAVNRGLVIACKTEAEAKRIIAKADKLGYEFEGKSWSKCNGWKEYKEDLCLHIAKGYTCNPTYAKRFGYPIINSLSIA